MSPTKTKDAPSRPSAKVTGSPADTPVPTQMPQDVAAAGRAAGPGVPVLAPPESEAAGLMGAQAEAQAIAAWQSVTVGGMWTSNHQSNAWAYLNGIGWRRISPANPVAHHAMLQILRLARDANLTVQCDEDGSLIHTVYVW
jgi:hypothetical protein